MEDRNNGHSPEERVFDREGLGADDFIYPQGTDNIKLLMTPGKDDPKNLYMRADLPTKRAAVAFAICETRDEKHGDIEGRTQLLKIMAALVGVGAKRANLVSDTIIGERRNAGMRRGMGDWIRDKAGIGGDKE